MSKYPSRPLTHNLEYQSELFLRNHLPQGWILDKPTDYGIDYNVSIVLDGLVKGYNFSIQLKSHEKIAKKNQISISLERSTVNLFLNRLEPILLICFISESNEAYYSWFTERTVDLTKKSNTYTIHIKESNKLSSLNWSDIANHVLSIFSRKFMLNALPEINFSEIANEDEKIASAHYIGGDFEIAEHLFKKLNSKKTSGAWLNSIAMCQYALHHYKEALATINQALEIANLQAIRINKACILAEYGIESHNKAMVLEASNIFKNVLNNADDAHYHFNYANTLSSLKDYQTAEIHFKKSLKLNPNYAEAWKNLGQLYSDRKNLGKEMQCYDNALAINPALPQALMSKGISLIKNYKKYQEGLNYLERTVELQPRLFLIYKNGYFWFAYAFFQIDNQQKGFEYLQKGLNQYPGDPYLLNLKRDYYKNSWQSSDQIRNDAKEFLLFRLELSPDDMLSLETICRIYIAENNLKVAIEQIRKHTVLLSKTNLELLLNEDIDLIDYLSSLYSYREYRLFRSQYPLEKYINTHISSTIYIEMTELVGLKLFHVSAIFCKNNRTLKQFEHDLVKTMLETAKSYYPKTAPYFITASVENTDLFGHQISELIVGLPQLAMEECARINSYLTIKLNLNNTKMTEAVHKADEKSISKSIWEDGLDKVQQRFHFFPDK